MNGKILILFCLLFLISCESAPFTTGLLECDTDVYKTQEDVSLFNAAKTGDMYNIKLALEEKANINVSDRLGQSALMWTGWNGHSEIIKYLVHYNDEQLTLKKKGKNKKYVPLKYKKISQEKYNALFCLIMSNSIQKKEALKCMKLLLEKEPSLLTITDKYNENCLHKAVRSGNKEYLEFFLRELKKRKEKRKKSVEQMKLSSEENEKQIAEQTGTPSEDNGKQKKQNRFIEQTNTFFETPLVLAVKLQDAEMVKILIKEGANIDVKLPDIKMKKLDGKEEKSKQTLSVIAFDHGQGDYGVFLEVMKEKLRISIENKVLPKDEELEKAFEIYTGKNTDISFFIKVYQKFSSGDIKNPDDLDDGAFKEKEVTLFNLLESADFSVQQNIDAVKEILAETPALVNSVKSYPKEDMRKTPLQLCIENGNIDLFNVVFQKINMFKIKGVGSGCGDYLVCAILKKRPKIIDVLLTYEEREENNFCPEELMAVHHGLSSKLSEFDTPIPLVQFIMTDKLRSNRDLLKKTLDYYNPQFAENTNYAGTIFEAALKCKDESLLLLIKEFPGFNPIEKVFEGRPLQYELIENNYFETLKYFINEGNLKFFWKDTKGKKHFKDILDDRKDEPEVAEIIELLESKNVIFSDVEKFFSDVGDGVKNLFMGN